MHFKTKVKFKASAKNYNSIKKIAKAFSKIEPLNLHFEIQQLTE